MMDVIVVATEDGGAAQRSTAHDGERVEQRHGHQQHGHQIRKQRRRSFRGERGVKNGNRQSVADEQTAGRAHEDTRRRQIVQQKTGHGPRQRDRQKRRYRLTRHYQDRRQKTRYDERHASGESVQAVEHVQRVRETDQPEDAHHGRKPHRQKRQVETCVGEEHHRRGHGGLRQEANANRNPAPQVVQQAHEEETETAHADDEQLWNHGLKALHRLHDLQGQKSLQPGAVRHQQAEHGVQPRRQHERAVYRHPAQKGLRVAMQLLESRPVHHAPAQRHPDRHAHQHSGGERAEKKHVSVEKRHSGPQHNPARPDIHKQLKIIHHGRRVKRFSGRDAATCAAKPTETRKRDRRRREQLGRGGLEPPTPGFSVPCSTI